MTAPVLSRLYDTNIEVVHALGNIFVLSRGHNVERSDHLHDHDHGGGDHVHDHQHDHRHA